MKFDYELIKKIRKCDIRTCAVVSRKEFNANRSEKFTTCLRFFIENRNPITNEYIGTSHIDFPIDLRIVDYGKDHYNRKLEDYTIFFYMYYSETSAIKTFILSTLKQDSDVRFLVLCNNNNQNFEAVGYACHQLFAEIENKTRIDTYFLSSEVGPQNSASPVQYL